jgi:hypothetical protein
MCAHRNALDAQRKCASGIGVEPADAFPSNFVAEQDLSVVATGEAGAE